jgi:hypothetical protein
MGPNAKDQVHVMVGSLRQGLGETHIFRAFFSNPSRDVLLRYSPGTQ